VLASCGGAGDPRRDVATTVQDFQAAAVDGNGDAYCDLLSGKGKEEALRGFAAIGGEFDCPKGLEKARGLLGKDEIDDLDEARKQTGPEDVTVRGDRARVTLPGGKQMRLIRSDGDWLINSIPKMPREKDRKRSRG
jgi:hypothetical protein